MVRRSNTNWLVAKTRACESAATRTKRLEMEEARRDTFKRDEDTPARNTRRQNDKAKAAKRRLISISVSILKQCSAKTADKSTDEPRRSIRIARHKARLALPVQQLSSATRVPQISPGFPVSSNTDTVRSFNPVDNMISYGPRHAGSMMREPMLPEVESEIELEPDMCKLAGVDQVSSESDTDSDLDDFAANWITDDILYSIDLQDHAKFLMPTGSKSSMPNPSNYLRPASLLFHAHSGLLAENECGLELLYNPSVGKRLAAVMVYRDRLKVGKSQERCAGCGQ